MIPKYEILEDDDVSKTARITILEGKFIGFVYCYGKVNFVDQEDLENPVLRFSYRLLAAPESYQIVDEELEKKEFENVLGNILHDLILSKNAEIRSN